MSYSTESLYNIAESDWHVLFNPELPVLIDIGYPVRPEKFSEEVSIMKRKFIYPRWQTR